MSTKFKDKLVRLFNLIEKSCNSSVRIFNADKGHSNRSVGFTAYEERQKALRDLSEVHPDIIEFYFRKAGHDYFKFEGKSLRIISSPRENLARKVFERNSVEKLQEEFGNFDPFRRVIYKTDYDIDAHEATILECYYLEIDRNTEEVLYEVNILKLSKDKSGYPSEVANTKADAVELPSGGLLESNVIKIEDFKEDE